MPSANEQRNVEVVQQAYAAFGRRDVEGILRLLSDDVDWTAVQGAGTRVPLYRPYRGRGDVGKFFASLAEQVEFQTFEPREFIAQGDKVVALGHYKARVKATGRTVETDWAMVFTVRNGNIVRFREYTDSLQVASAFA